MAHRAKLLLAAYRQHRHGPLSLGYERLVVDRVLIEALN
jgi:hypothetical protein